MSEPEEIAKAVAEVAKYGTKALDSSDKLGGFLSKTFGVPIENAIGIMSDKLDYVRWERTTRMIDKVNEYQEKRGLFKVRPIPPKFAIPMIENASWEEDDDLQDMWCRLIVNSLDLNFESEIRYAFIDIIKNLTSFDARILKYVYDTVLREYLYHEDSNDRFNFIKSRDVYVYNLKEDVNATQYDIEASLDNLYRVGCLESSKLQDTIAKMAYYPNSLRPVDNRVHLTHLGIMFVEACLKL